MSSEQWLARIGLIAALGASEVVLAAVCGIEGLRLIALAVAAFAFVIAYIVTPSPGRNDYDAVPRRPLLVMRASTLLAAAATGGLASPLLPLVAAPVIASWTLYRHHTRDMVVTAVTVCLMIVPVAASVMSPLHLASVRFAVLAGWSTLLATLATGRRIQQLRAVQRTQAACLGRLREGALADATSRRHGLQSMTTKLAHELKNPLAAIKVLVQVELRQASDERGKRRLEVTLGEVSRIESILREYLELERPVEEARIGPVHLDELMADITTLLEGRAEAAGVELAVEGTGGVLHADGRLLKEAIVNVISNAIEATSRGGLVSVSYHRDPTSASIIICDSGRGMTHEVAARVGSPYFTTREGGTGLGILIARTAIAQHGGTLAYQSTPGAGTTATIALPVEPRDGAAP